MKIVQLEEEISRLRSLIDKLREGVDTFRHNFGQENRPDNKTITDYVMGVRTNMIDRILTFANAQKNKTIRELSYRCLSLNRLLGRQIKKFEYYEKRKIDEIKGADQRQLISIWGHLRELFVEFLFDIYVRSTDPYDESKANSFLLYKINMEEVCKTHYEYLFMIVPVY